MMKLEKFLRYVSDNQKGLVESLLKGYKEYIDERIEKKKEMIVSNGYAWTKANHIENAVGKYIKNNLNDTMSFSKSKAGFSWVYLQFKNDVTKSLLIIREVEAIKKGSNPKEYLKNLVKINGEEKKAENGYDQLTLWDNGEATLPEKLSDGYDGFDNFYILTYRIDNKTKEIAQIKIEKPMLNLDEKIYFDENTSLELSIESNNPYQLSMEEKNNVENMDDIIGGFDAEPIILSGSQYDTDIKKKEKQANG